MCYARISLMVYMTELIMSMNNRYRTTLKIATTTFNKLVTFFILGKVSFPLNETVIFIERILPVSGFVRRLGNRKCGILNVNNRCFLLRFFHYHFLLTVTPNSGGQTKNKTFSALTLGIFKYCVTVRSEIDIETP